MNFWKTQGYTYSSFIDLPVEKVETLTRNLDRLEIIEWLEWNDRNGIYNDQQSLKELGNILSKEEGIEIMLRQIEQGRPLVI